MKFRDFINREVRSFSLYEDEVTGKIGALLDHNNLVMFFSKGEDVFGTGEDGRVVFAKLKKPDEETTPGWVEEASFSAINLSKAVNGNPAQHVFSKKDLKEIKIIDRDDAAKKLESHVGKGKEISSPIKVINISSLFDKDSDEAPNFIQAKEKE